jgi:hypothetical protein
VAVRLFFRRLAGLFLEDGLRDQAAAFEIDQKTVSASRSALTGVRTDAGSQRRRQREPGADESNAVAGKAYALASLTAN